MSADLQEQAVKVTWKTTEISAKTLKALIETLLANREKTQHGEQKLSKLNMQNRQLESVELSGSDIKAFRQELNKYSVDFSVMKDRSNGNYTVFFKGQDVDRVYQGLQSCIKGLDMAVNKKPIKEVMEQAEKRSAERAAAKTAPEKSRSAERGHEER